MKPEISNRLSIWPRRKRGDLSPLWHYECYRDNESRWGLSSWSGAVTSAHLLTVTMLAPDTMDTCGLVTTGDQAWPDSSSHFTADSRFIWYPCYLVTGCLDFVCWKQDSRQCHQCLMLCTMYLLLQRLLHAANITAVLTAALQQASNLEQLPTCRSLQGYAVTLCGAEYVPDSECLCMMSIFEEDILIQTDSSNYSGVSHLTRQATTPWQASGCDTW